jgi:hypothetical protein
MRRRGCHLFRFQDGFVSLGMKKAAWQFPHTQAFMPHFQLMSTPVTANSPLGVFDSGVGGLTVVRALRDLLPNESIIYLGDTARVPYGSKSPDTIRRFSMEDTQFLVSHGVKAVVVACNTATAHALPFCRRRFGCR